MSTSSLLGSWRLPWGTEESGTQRELSTETLRGLAIVLMVSGHVIGYTSERGMRVADDSGYRHFVDALIFLRMPLFTVISGYVYAIRPTTAGNVLRFLRGKARRLLFPLFTLSTLQFSAKALAPGVNDPAKFSEMWRIYLFPFDQFWFIQALTGIFLVTALLDGRALMASVRSWLVWFCLAVLASLYMPIPTAFFSLPNLLYLLPYFLFGVGLRRFVDLFARRDLAWFAGVAFGTTFTLHQLSLLGLLDHRFGPTDPVALSIGVAGCYLLFRLRFAVTWLAWLGSYAYSIYLLHAYPVSGSRIVLYRLGFDNQAIVFVTGLVCGVLIPIVLDRALRLNSWTRLLFLGLRGAPRDDRTDSASLRPVVANKK